MQYRFITNLILVLLLNFLVKPFWIFGIDRTVQIELGAQEYGSFYALFSFSFLFNILLDLGITNFNNKNISANNDLLKKHFTGIFSVKILLGVAYLLVSLLFAAIAEYSVEQFMLLLFLLFNQFLVSVILYLRSNISGLHYFKVDSIISVLDRLLMILFCSAILWGNIEGVKMNIKLFVFSQTAAYFLTFITAMFFVMIKAKNKTFKLDFPFSIAIIKKSWPYALLILLMTLYTRIDAVMLERMLPDTGKQEAGEYAHSYRILEALNMIAFLFAGLLLPMYTKMLAQKESINELTYLASKLLLFPALAIVITCYVNAKEIMQLLYPTDYIYVYETFAILIITFLPISAGYIFGTLITANGNMKELNQVSITALILNITINSMLIPVYGAYGAAVATLITQSLAVILQIVMAFKIFNLSISKQIFIKIIGVILLSVLIYLTNSLINFGWIIKFLLSIILFALYGFATNLINLQVLYTILKEKR